jgi:hypothetical protein
MSGRQEERGDTEDSPRGRMECGDAAEKKEKYSVRCENERFEVDFEVGFVLFPRTVWSVRV